MQRIVVAAKAGADQPWLADAAAELAHQTGAAVSVVSARRPRHRGPLPHAALGVPRRGAGAPSTASSSASPRPASRPRATCAPGSWSRGVLLYAEEKDADLIVCGASTKGRVARKVLGSVPVELIQRARRPVLVITPS